MTPLRTIISGMILGVVLVPLLLQPVTAAVRGSHTPGVGSAPLLRPIIVKGRILCTQCTLNAIRKEHGGRNLYEFTNQRGTMVFKLAWVNDRHLWKTIVWPPRLRVRASATVLDRLTSTKNVGAEVQLSGYLRNTRTFDISQLTRKAQSRRSYS